MSRTKKQVGFVVEPEPELGVNIVPERTKRNDSEFQLAAQMFNLIAENAYVSGLDVYSVVKQVGEIARVTKKSERVMNRMMGRNA